MGCQGEFGVSRFGKEFFRRGSGACDPRTECVREKLVRAGQDKNRLPRVFIGVDKADPPGQSSIGGAASGRAGVQLAPGGCEIKNMRLSCGLRQEGAAVPEQIVLGEAERSGEEEKQEEGDPRQR